MNSDNKESVELEQRMKIALQKAGDIIPSDLGAEGEPPAEAMAIPIPQSLSNIDAAMDRILGDEEDDKIDDSKLLEFSADASNPFAIAARNGGLKLSEESINKLKRDDE